MTSHLRINTTSHDNGTKTVTITATIPDDTHPQTLATTIAAFIRGTMRPTDGSDWTANEYIPLTRRSRRQGWFQ